MAELIGRGALAEVTRHGDVAVKAVPKALLVALRCTADAVQEQAALHAACSGPEVPRTLARLLGTAQDERCVYFRLEAITVAGMSVQLRQLLLAQRGALPAVPAACVTGCLLGALAHLHACGVVHRDVKPENLVLGVDGMPRLIDFGHATLLDATAAGGHAAGAPVAASTAGAPRGTPPYAAPELLGRAAHGSAVDCWAAGVVAHELLVGAPPAVAAATAVTAAATAAAAAAPAAALLESLLRAEPAARTTAAVASEDEWLRGHGWAASQLRDRQTEPWLAAAAAREAARGARGGGGARGEGDEGAAEGAAAAREAAAWEAAERDELLERGEALRKREPARWAADFEAFGAHASCAPADGAGAAEGRAAAAAAAAAPAADHLSPPEDGRTLQAAALAMREALLSGAPPAAAAPATEAAAGARRAPPRLLVGVRVRPLVGDEATRLGRAIPGHTLASFAQYEYEAVVADEARGAVHVLAEARGLGGQPAGGLAARRFGAHAVFGAAASTARVFERAVAPLVEACLGSAEGETYTAIAFGPTGAGKTHTMRGLQRLCVRRLLRRGAGGEAGRGGPAAFEGGGARGEEAAAPAAPAAPAEGAAQAAARAAAADGEDDGAGGEAGGAPLLLSVFEVAGERCADLLHGGAALSLRDDGRGGLVVAGLREARAASEAAALALLDAAHGARATRGTQANAASSRSHAVCCLRLAGGAARAPSGTLRLVDLAGSERRTDAAAHGAAALAEMGRTNRDLGCLKECLRLRLLRAEGGGARAHVPFRRSKLTRLLRSSLVAGAAAEGAAADEEGAAAADAAVAFLAHVSPLRSAGQHALGTLDYVEQMVAPPRAAREFAAFNDVERWSARRVVAWVAALEGGRYAHVAESFARFSGKALSCEYVIDVIKHVEAGGGTAEEAEAIHEAFRAEHKAAKRRARPDGGGKPGAPPRAGKGAGEGGGACAARGDFVVEFASFLSVSR